MTWLGLALLRYLRFEFALTFSKRGIKEAERMPNSII